VLQCYNLAVFRAGTRSDEVFQDLPGVSCRVFDAGRRPLQTGCPVPQQHPRRRRNAVESRTACDACATCKQVFCVTVWDIVNVARLRRSGTCKLRGLMSSGFLVRGVGGFDGWGGGGGGGGGGVRATSSLAAVYPPTPPQKILPDFYFSILSPKKILPDFYFSHRLHTGQLRGSGPLNPPPRPATPLFASD